MLRAFTRGRMVVNAACFARCGNDCLFFDACYYDYKCLMYETE